MTKLNLFLLALLLGSCLVLVRTAYESRRIFTALDQARLAQRQLDADYRRLDAEAKAQGTHLLIERTARERLKMRTATAAVTTYVNEPPRSLTVAAPGLQKPGGALLRPGEAGSAAEFEPPRSLTVAAPRGGARLRPGEAGSAALPGQGPQ